MDKQKSPCGLYEQKDLIIGGKTIKVDVADNNCKVVQGLSDRKSMSIDRGMIFIFEKKVIMVFGWKIWIFQLIFYG